ncbi:carboxypeptidase regulatory-like domain-containing protein [Gimesia sp.]|uniref:carboxypeptidase regulatory-like domain-containing protein n=1 Tax=Gimesia sp. TaxID=2024833 RepID=UPI003A8DF11A
MQRSISLKLIPVLILYFSLTSCSQGPTDTPPLAPVKGVVTLDGKPLTTGTIQFTPDKDRGTTGRMALGGIKEDGTFELMTIKKGDGAQVGHHLVSIECYESSAFDPNQPVNQTPKSLIPNRYTDPKKSELTAQVQAGEENNFTFQLTSKP